MAKHTLTSSRKQHVVRRTATSEETTFSVTFFLRKLKTRETIGLSAIKLSSSLKTRLLLGLNLGGCSCHQ